MQHNEPDAFFAVVHNGTILGVSDRSAEGARQDAIAAGHGVGMYSSIADAKLTRAPNMDAETTFVAEMTERAYALFVDSDGEVSEGYAVRDGLVDVGSEVPVEYDACEGCGREYRPQAAFKPGCCGPCSAVIGLHFVGWR